MESLTDSAVDTIVIIEDPEPIVVIEDPVADAPHTPARRAGDRLLVSPFANDPFVVDWAPPQS